MADGRRQLGAAGVLLGSSLAGVAAAAEDSWEAQGGLFVSVHVGPGGWRLGAGLEARAVRADMSSLFCGEARAFGAAVARLAVVGTDQARLLVGGQIGRFGSTSAAAAEVAAARRFWRDPGWHLQLGVDGDLGPINARLAYAILRDAQLAAGTRVPWLPPFGCGVPGRPLRREGTRAPAPDALIASPSTPSDREAEIAAEAARTWARRAAAEWASVPAFLELEAQLEQSRAPIALRARARAAAVDELRHAVLAGSIACRLAGDAPISLDPPTRSRREALAGIRGLERLAVESFVDGCVGESAAAACAALEAAASRLPEIRAAQEAIADDEARHSSLAWDVLAWALAAGRTPVREAVRSAARSLPRPVPRDEVPGQLRELGCLSQAEAAAVHGAIRERAEGNLRGLLDARAPSRRSGPC